MQTYTIDSNDESPITSNPCKSNAIPNNKPIFVQTIFCTNNNKNTFRFISYQSVSIPNHQNTKYPIFSYLYILC